MNRLVAVALLVVQVLAYGVVPQGGNTGGGNVVECPKPEGTYVGMETVVSLLDYHEAEINFPDFKIDLGKGKDELALVRNVLDRMSRLDKDRAADYWALASRFHKEANFVTGVQLPIVDDLGPVIMGEGCKVVQVAVQNMTKFKATKKYTVHKGIWDKMPTRDRAGLILHEVVYNEALNRSRAGSLETRYINSLISSALMGSLDAKDYEDHLKDAEWDPGYRSLHCVPYEYIYKKGKKSEGFNISGGFESSRAFKMVGLKAPPGIVFFPGNEIAWMQNRLASGKYGLSSTADDGARQLECPMTLIVE